MVCGGGVERGGVLQHHDARAVVPLDADAAGRLDHVRGARVVDVQEVPAEGQPGRPQVHRHLGGRANRHSAQPAEVCVCVCVCACVCVCVCLGAYV